MAHTSRSLSLEKISFLIFIGALSLYVLYEQVVNCHAIDMATQLFRHNNVLEGKSEFFNPWQYRVLSVYLVEFLQLFFLRIFDNHYYAFYFLRFLQNLAIFVVAYKYYKALELKSDFLIVLGILLLGYNMSHSVFQSDLSLNTYFDVLFYLLTGYLIVMNKALWILPLIVIAALNRETSILIPILLAGCAIDFTNKKIANRQNIKIAVWSLVFFMIIFISLRLYYGMPSAVGIHGMQSPLEYLKFNLTFFRMYPELFGTLGIIPLIVILRFKSLNNYLRTFFFLLVPVWFIIHFLKSTAVETRLFLVPQALVFIPACLKIIEKEIIDKLSINK